VGWICVFFYPRGSKRTDVVCLCQIAEDALSPSRLLHEGWRDIFKIMRITYYFWNLRKRIIFRKLSVAAWDEGHPMLPNVYGFAESHVPMLENTLVFRLLIVQVTSIVISCPT
jgi:hypothetical protein